MKFKGLIVAAAVAALAPALHAKAAPLPEGWVVAGGGTARRDCSSDIREVSGAPSPRVFHIECPAGVTEFVTVMQQVSAVRYAGHRVRLQAWLHGRDTGKVQLWMRADSGRQSGTAFDNMDDRPLAGSFGWQAADVVLDIPADATTLSFGFFQVGEGSSDSTQYRLDIVPPSVPVTGKPRPSLPDLPQNLTPP